MICNLFNHDHLLQQVTGDHTPQTSTTVVLGYTPSYSPLEQIQGIGTDSRSDLYALAATLYHLLTGVAPSDAVSRANAIVNGEPDPLRPANEVNAHVTAEVAVVLKQAMALKRDQRQTSAAEVRQALRDARQPTGPIASAKVPVFSALTEVNSSQTQQNPGQASATTLIDSSTRAIPQVMTSPSVKRGSSLNLTGRNKLLPRRTVSLGVALGLLLLVGMGWLLVKSWAGPEIGLNYYLTVQKVRDGKDYMEPFQSSGREIFENGWRFRLNISSQQPGYLYLLNDGPAGTGANDILFLYPNHQQLNGSAQLAAGEALQLPWMAFDEHMGTEKIWVIWSRGPVSVLETVKNVILSKDNNSDQPPELDPVQLNSVRAFLATHISKPAIEKDTENKQTIIRARGDFMVYLLELEHH